eukprot:355559-Chlamydomonas_euryale.AAC.2
MRSARGASKPTAVEQVRQSLRASFDLVADQPPGGNSGGLAGPPSHTHPVALSLAHCELPHNGSVRFIEDPSTHWRRYDPPPPDWPHHALPHLVARHELPHGGGVRFSEDPSTLEKV